MPAARLFVIPMILFLFGCDQDEVEPEPLSVETEQEKKLYALGQAVARQFVLPGLFDDGEITIVGRGFKDAVARRDTLVDFDSLVEPMNVMLTARRAVKNLQWGIEFRKMAATWPGAISTETGLIFQSVEDGTGASPTVDDTVAAHFKGKFIDGRTFDSSVDKGVANFALNQVMSGWTEAFQMMKVGGKARFVLPLTLPMESSANSQPSRLTPRSFLKSSCWQFNSRESRDYEILFLSSSRRRRLNNSLLLFN